MPRMPRVPPFPAHVFDAVLGTGLATAERRSHGIEDVLFGRPGPRAGARKPQILGDADSGGLSPPPSTVAVRSIPTRRWIAMIPRLPNIRQKALANSSTAPVTSQAKKIAPSYLGHPVPLCQHE